MLLGSWIFVVWLRTARPLHCWTAFGLAGLAFFCRVTTAGILPAWFLYASWIGQGRRLILRHLILASVLYLAAAVSFVGFVAQFNKFEVAADGKAEGLSWKNLDYFTDTLPLVATPASTVAALAGAACAARGSRSSTLGRFWGAWLMSYTGFKLVMPTTPEPRHFLTALPAYSGLAVCLFHADLPVWWRRGLAPLLLVLALGNNLVEVRYLPRGIVGYDAVARQLARADKTGNVLLACWYDQDLMFRYRCQSCQFPRYRLRSDRTLAVRFPDYAGVTPQILAKSPEDVLDCLRRGRARYLVTTCPIDQYHDRRVEEMRLAHATAQSRPDDFTLLGSFPLLVEFDRPGFEERVFLWEFTRPLPSGPSDLPIIVPTADLEFRVVSQGY